MQDLQPQVPLALYMRSILLPSFQQEIGGAQELLFYSHS